MASHAPRNQAVVRRKTVPPPFGPPLVGCAIETAVDGLREKPVRILPSVAGGDPVERRERTGRVELEDGARIHRRSSPIRPRSIEVSVSAFNGIGTVASAREVMERQSSIGIEPEASDR